MPVEKRWANPLTHQDRVDVRFIKERGQILDFSVQYVAEIAGEWRPIIRFDSAHGEPHMNVTYPDGSSERRDFPAPYGDYKTAMTRAIQDINQRWEFYRQRYERWQRQ